MQKDLIGLNAGDTNLYRYVSNNPNNFTDPYGLDSYRTNAGHGYLVIDDPAGSGGVYFFTFGSRNDNYLTIAKILLGQPVDAFAGMDFIPKGESRAFLGFEVPFSRISQDALADQATIHRAQDFIKETNTEGNYYSLFNFGDNGYNCIGAAREVQCGNKCGGR